MATVGYMRFLPHLTVLWSLVIVSTVGMAISVNKDGMLVVSDGLEQHHTDGGNRVKRAANITEGGNTVSDGGSNVGRTAGLVFVFIVLLVVLIIILVLIFLYVRRGRQRREMEQKKAMSRGGVLGEPSHANGFSNGMGSRQRLTDTSSLFCIEAAGTEDNNNKKTNKSARSRPRSGRREGYAIDRDPNLPNGKPPTRDRMGSAEELSEMAREHFQSQEDLHAAAGEVRKPVRNSKNRGMSLDQGSQELSNTSRNRMRRNSVDVLDGQGVEESTEFIDPDAIRPKGHKKDEPLPKLKTDRKYSRSRRGENEDADDDEERAAEEGNNESKERRRRHRRHRRPENGDGDGDGDGEERKRRHRRHRRHRREREGEPETEAEKEERRRRRHRRHRHHRSEKSKDGGGDDVTTGATPAAGLPNREPMADDAGTGTGTGGENSEEGDTSAWDSTDIDEEGFTDDDILETRDVPTRPNAGRTLPQPPAVTTGLPSATIAKAIYNDLVHDSMLSEQDMNPAQTSTDYELKYADRTPKKVGGMPSQSSKYSKDRGREVNVLENSTDAAIRELGFSYEPSAMDSLDMLQEEYEV